MGYAYTTTPLPNIHAAKSLPEHKLSAANPIATLRVTVETSSTSTPTNSDYEQPAKKSIEQQNTRAADDSSNSNGAVDDANNNHIESITSFGDAAKSDEFDEKVETTTSVEQRLRKISEEVGKISLSGNAENYERQSFLSLSDLMKSLRPSDRRHPPQIDSDYSNTMHVLGERASIVGGDSSRKVKTIDLRQTNRALY